MIKYKDNLSIKSKAYRLIFNIIWGFLNIRPRKTFNKFSIFILKLFGAKIGKNSTIYSGVTIWDPRNLYIGNYVTIGPKVNLYCVDKIHIDDYAQISQNSNLITASHNINSNDFELIHKPIFIKKSVWVAANATILMGVTLNNNVVVGFGSVVSKDLMADGIYVGNPSVLKGYRKKN